MKQDKRKTSFLLFILMILSILLIP